MDRLLPGLDPNHAYTQEQRLLLLVERRLRDIESAMDTMRSRMAAIETELTWWSEWEQSWRPFLRKIWRSWQGYAAPVVDQTGHRMEQEP